MSQARRDSGAPMPGRLETGLRLGAMSAARSELPSLIWAAAVMFLLSHAAQGFHVAPVYIGHANASLPQVSHPHCAREIRPEAAAHVGQTPASRVHLAIVLLLCKEDLMPLVKGLMCWTHSKRLWFHVYLRCAKPSGHVFRQMSTVRHCTTVHDAETGTNQHVMAHHTMAQYLELPAKTVFMSPAAMSSAAAFHDIVHDALISPAAFKTYGSARALIPTPRIIRLCDVIQRYTCIDACNPVVIQALGRWATTTPGQEMTVLVTSERVRLLAVYEYAWIHSWARREQAVLVNNIWRFLWGCPEDAGNMRHVGCSSTQRFPFGSAGLSTLRLKGLVAGPNGDILQPRALRVLPQVCVKRSVPELQPTVPAYRLGIVAVVCDESLTPFLSLTCNMTDPEVLLHFYSKCGLGRSEALEKLGHMAPCVATFREVQPTLETDLSWPKHHRDYLEHIITKFDGMEPLMMFLKGNFLRRRLELDVMVQDMLEKRWAFKSYGLPKIELDLEGFPEEGHRLIWRKEMCALYQRYHCIDICSDSKALQKANFQPVIYNTRSMWAASAARIRSLPLSEYMWWREYISAPAFQEGVKRRYMLERLWQALLGCPEEHDAPDHNQAFGCTDAMHHPQGTATAPPVLLRHEGLASWPQNTTRVFDPQAMYPSFMLPQPGVWHGGHPPVTFVTTFVPTKNQKEDGRQLHAKREAMSAAARFHPGCRFILLTTSNAKIAFLTDEYFGGRLTIITYNTTLPNKQKSYVPSGLRAFLLSVSRWFWHTGSANEYIKPVKPSRITLEATFLNVLAQEGNTSSRLGNLVMTDFMSLALAPFHDAFNGNSEQRVAFAVSGTNEDFRIKGDTWFICRRGVAFAAKLASAAMKRILSEDCRGPNMYFGKVFSDIINTHLTKRCDGGDGQQGGCILQATRHVADNVRFIPCNLWMSQLDDDIQGCPVAGVETKSIVYGRTGFGRRSLVEGALKVKDKAAGKPAIKNAILHFLAEKGDQLDQTTVNYYVNLLESPSMEAIPVPPEKRGPPQIGKSAHAMANVSQRVDAGLR